MVVITKLVSCTSAQMQQFIWFDIVPLGLTGLFFVSCTASLAGESILGDLEASLLPSAAPFPFQRSAIHLLHCFQNLILLEAYCLEIETLQSCS